MFQSYQFRQINPDTFMKVKLKKTILKFQSYQFRQINPDVQVMLMIIILLLGFNRINSGRSIQT